MQNLRERQRRVNVNVESLEERQLLTTIQQFPVTPTGTFVGQMASGPGGDVWFLKLTKQTSDFSLELTSRLAHISTAGKVTDYPLPGPQGTFDGPQAIAGAPDGSLYILMQSSTGNARPTYGIDRIAPDGELTELQLSQPIVSGEFLKYPSSYLDGTVNTLNQTKPTYSTPYLTVGGDGNIYLASFSTIPNPIDRITPDGIVTEIPTGRFPQGQLAVGVDGSVYFASSKLSPDGTVTDFVAPSGGAIQSLAAGVDGNVYFTESFANSDPTRAALIGKITPAGVITEYSLSNPGGGIGQLTQGPDGNIWFTETVNNSTDPSKPHTYKVGEIDHAGVITETTVSSSTQAYVDVDAGSITTGPNGQIWFAENDYPAGHSQIGELIRANRSLMVTGINQRTTQSKSTDIILSFSDTLEPLSARSLINYRLVAEAHAGNPSHTIRIRSVSYTPGRHSVTLHIHGRLAPHQTYKLTVNGITTRGVTSTSGVLLSGTGTGLPGSNYQATVPYVVAHFKGAM